MAYAIYRGGRAHDKAWFLDRVEKEPMSGCWLWMGSTADHGYGRVQERSGDRVRAIPAHRFAYELWVGPIQAALELDHKCRVRCCVNPNHLRPVTHKENMFAPGSMNIGKANGLKTACPRGHEYTPENTQHWKRDGGRRTQRVCVACLRKWTKRYNAKRRQEKQ